jgi:hypothetical protein
MNRLGLFAAAMAIVALPAGVLGKPEHKPIKVKNTATNEKSVPAPAPLILIGVAAGVAGLVRRAGRRRTPE